MMEMYEWEFANSIIVPMDNTIKGEGYFSCRQEDYKVIQLITNVFFDYVKNFHKGTMIGEYNERIEFKFETRIPRSAYYLLCVLHTYGTVLRLSGGGHRSNKEMFRFAVENGELWTYRLEKTLVRVNTFEDFERRLLPKTLGWLKKTWKTRIRLNGESICEEAIVPYYFLEPLLRKSDYQIEILEGEQWKSPCDVCLNRLRKQIQGCMRCEFKEVI